MTKPASEWGLVHFTEREAIQMHIKTSHSEKMGSYFLLCTPDGLPSDPIAFQLWAVQLMEFDYHAHLISKAGFFVKSKSSAFKWSGNYYTEP